MMKKLDIKLTLVEKKKFVKYDKNHNLVNFDPDRSKFGK